MLLLPLFVVALVGYAVYTVVHRRAQPAAGMAEVPAAMTVPRAPFWPTTLEGRLGIGAFALGFLPWVLVNVIQVPYLSAGLLLASVVLTGFARFAGHDSSTTVLIAFAVSAFATLAGLLFLAGEIFIGHD